jgi:NADPH-dependent 2,4-dienoyl-CoA reductase/sulfur reductase-like enzyme/rhodanese-related sulfurtransferase
VSIDRPAKRVVTRNLDTDEIRTIDYDRLILATGSRPHRLPIDGADLDGVHTVSDLGGAIAIRDEIAAGRVGTAAVIGGGAIGLEMSEALSDLWGVETSLIEIQDQLLPQAVGPVLARMVQQQMAEHDIDVYLSEKVERIEGENGRAVRVVTDRRTLDVDLVVMAVGVGPQSELARAAGLDITETGAIWVDEYLRTSDPDVYAGGDCIDNVHLVSGRRVHLALGSLANRQGRIVGTNVAGGSRKWDGVVGSFILKTFDLAVASTGLSLAQAQAAGIDAFSTLVVQADRAHFYPGNELMYLELIAEKPSGRVLGAAGVSPLGDALAARIDAVAALLKYRPHVSDISNLELAYAPPFASAMDILNALGNTAENILAGKNRPVDVDEFTDLFEERSGDDFVCLDVRAPAQAEPFMDKYPGAWINVPQEQLAERIAEIPEDKDLVVICNSGVRSYEAQVRLDQLGRPRTRNLQGGIGALKKFGWDDQGETD